MNRDGFVINIQRGLNPSDARLHHAHCRWISGTNQQGGPWTENYVKCCAADLHQLDAWALARVGRTTHRCGTCHPPCAETEAAE